MNKVHRIVLTGAPGAGKTTAMASITERLQYLGYQVYVVPEVASMFILGGMNINDPNIEMRMHAQETLLKTIIHLEDSFFDLAKKSNKPTVILCDRGTMDGKAFTDAVIWQSLTDENRWSSVGLRDLRYEAVLHLSSAPKEHYTLENNRARSETFEQAQELDVKIQNAWLGHPHLRVIASRDNFADKIKEVISAVCHIIGEPEPVENERKFLVEEFAFPANFKHEIVRINQTYLLSTDDQVVERVRRRGQHGVYSYTHTTKKFLKNGSNIEIEKLISSKEYIKLLSKADPKKKEISKNRICFLWENKYFELDVFSGFKSNLTLLEVEVERLDEKINLPPFIKVIREVTEEKQFTNVELSEGY